MSDHDFDAVFQDHHAFAWRVLARHGVKARELEDACQEVFLALFRSMDRFEGRSSLRTWIYGICRRVAANFRRRQSTRQEIVSQSWDESLAIVGDHGDQGDQFAGLLVKQALRTLHELLERLTPPQREVFVLYEIEELTMREVAAAIGCPLHTAFARLYAARRVLEDALSRAAASSGEVA